MWPQHRRLHAEQRMALMAFQQPLNLGTGMRHFPKRRLPRLGVGLGRAVEKSGAYAGFKQPCDGRVVVRRRRVVVAPVGKQGGAAVELVQRAHQRGDVQVFRRKHGGQTGVHFLKVFQQRPVGRQPAQGRLPRVHVGVDQAGDDDESGGVHHLRVIGTDGGCNLGKRVARDENVALRQVALRVHRDDGGVADQGAFHATAHGQVPCSLSSISLFSDTNVNPASLAVSCSKIAKSTLSCLRPTIRETDSRVAAAAGMATP